MNWLRRKRCRCAASQHNEEGGWVWYELEGGTPGHVKVQGVLGKHLQAPGESAVVLVRQASCCHKNWVGWARASGSRQGLPSGSEHTTGQFEYGQVDEDTHIHVSYQHR